MPPSTQQKLHWDNFCKSENLIFQLESLLVWEQFIQTHYIFIITCFNVLMFSKAFLGKRSYISFGQEKEGVKLKWNHQPCGDTTEVIVLGAWVTSEYQPGIRSTQFQKNHSVPPLPCTRWMVLPGWLSSTSNLISSCFLCVCFLFGS